VLMEIPSCVDGNFTFAPALLHNSSEAEQIFHDVDR